MRIGIVGGGIYGTAIAYFLEKFANEDVVLFETDSIGGVSTSKSAGIVRHHYSNDFHISFAKRGQEIIANLGEYTGNDGGFNNNGYLIMADGENETEFRENVRLQQQEGVDVEILSVGDISSRVPPMDTADITIGALEYDGGYADPYLVASAFANRARELGTEIRTNSPITDVQLDGNTIQAVESLSGTDSIDLLINAAGPSSDEVAAMAGINLPLKRYEVKLVVLSPTESVKDYPVMSDIGSGLYMKPEPGGNILAGGIERTGGHAPLDNQELEGVTNEDLLVLEKRLSERFPGLTETDVVDSWSGIITASPDWHQIIGIPEGCHNLYNVAAGSGHGFKEAPGFAETIALDILREPYERNLHPYRLERFEEGDTIPTGYKDGTRA